MSDDKYLQHLMALIGSNRVLASYEFMKKLPANTPIPNKHNLFTDLEAKVKQARIHAREANLHIKKAAYPKAAEALYKARRFAPDFPNIQNDIDFIEGTIANLEQSLARAEVAAKKGQLKTVREYLNTASKIDRTNIAIPRIKKRLQKAVRRRKARTIIVASLLTISPFAYYGYEQLSFAASNTHWSKANAYISHQEYGQAKNEMDLVRDKLENVRLLNQVDKNRLLVCVQNMVDSERFQQGLVGKVLHQGRFIDIRTKRQLDRIALLAHKAEQKMADQKWSAALKDYQQALEVALTDEEVHAQAIDQLRTSILKLRDTMYSQYKQKDRASFRSMVQQADLFFAERRWAEAMDSYDQALRFARDNRVSDYELVSRITKARHESEINNNLEEAQALLKVNKQQQARTVFERILTIIDENSLQGLAAQPVSQKMIAQIDRNLFIEKINRLEEKAAALKADKKYNKALAHYRELQTELVSKGAIFQVDVASRQEKLDKAFAEISMQETQASHYKYILSAYQKILRDKLNLSNKVELHQPEIVFLKDENGVLVYKVTAFGSQGSGLPTAQTRYEVDLKIDKKAQDLMARDMPTSS